MNEVAKTKIDNINLNCILVSKITVSQYFNKVLLIWIASTSPIILVNIINLDHIPSKQVKVRDIDIS